MKKRIPGMVGKEHSFVLSSTSWIRKPNLKPGQNRTFRKV